MKKPGKLEVKRGLYTLRVSLVDGPLTDEFVDENPEVSRLIQIRGDQTLGDLHEAIFDAFDRFDEHMYEFQFGKRPQDPKGERYVMPMMMDDDYAETEPAGDVCRTRIGSLELKKRQKFLYWFDFGDDWWHQIEVVEILPEVPKGKFPKLIESVGKSPPQYPNWDEEYDEGDDEEYDEEEEESED